MVCCVSTAVFLALYLQTLTMGLAHRRCLLQFLYCTFPIEVHMHLHSYIQNKHIISLASPPTPHCSLSCVQSPRWTAPTGTNLELWSCTIPPHPHSCASATLASFVFLDDAKSLPTSKSLHLWSSLLECTSPTSTYGWLLLIKCHPLEEVFDCIGPLAPFPSHSIL